MLNWLARYAPVAAVLEEGEAPRGSILDVGSGSHGLACVTSAPFVGAPFVGVDVAFDAPTAASMVALKAPPGPLPFADRAFDTVLSIDTLEHIPPGDRPSFVRELARVAAGRVVLACPSREAEASDAMLRGFFERSGARAPSWLEEHDEHGLPTADDILDSGAAVDGFAMRELPVVNGLLSLMAVLADVLPELAPLAAQAANRDSDRWRELFRAGRFGDSFRKGFVLEREPATRGLVDPARLAESLIGALRCVACGETVEALAEDLWQCEGCHRLLAPDANGAWDLGAAGQRPVAAPAPPRRRTLRLVADWERPETWLPAVSAFLAARPSSPPADLIVSGGTAVPPNVAEAMLDVLRRRLGVTRREVLVAGRGDVDAEDAQGPEALRLALGAEPRPEHDADPDAIVAHARTAKHLTDEVQAVADRHRLQAAPATMGDTEPLVSVPIHTWRGGEVLVSRTIPSVLNGSYERVEVVVCSDGPDAETRHAVESIGDPRLRYLEVPTRPRYPDHPYSFWLTAGTVAANHARAACRGSFIAPLDHDDAFTTDHIAALLTAARVRGADLVYGKALCEHPDGHWFTIGSEPLAMGQVTHGAVLHSRRVGHMGFDQHCWLLGQPGDWNLWSRMAAIAARVHHHPEIVLAHFREKSSVSADARIERRHLIAAAAVDNEDLAHDVLETDARWLLSVDVARG